jgi:hypothetical protein
MRNDAAAPKRRRSVARGRLLIYAAAALGSLLLIIPQICATIQTNHADLSASGGGEQLLQRRVATTKAMTPSSQVSCATWCTNPCAELSGDPSAECSGCTHDLACHYGAPSFETTKRAPPVEDTALAAIERKPTHTRTTNAALTSTVRTSRVVCPKIFIYNASILGKYEPQLTLQGYGPRISNGPSWLRDTDQHALGALILSRLLRFPRCTTSNASEARLFIVPLLHILNPVTKCHPTVQT